MRWTALHLFDHKRVFVHQAFRTSVLRIPWRRGGLQRMELRSLSELWLHIVSTDSAFLSIAPSEWVASNDLAFAVRDRFPDSKGHTLVILKRLIATWFDATAAERLAIFALVDEVKAALDAELAPQGYNVGFNAGVAAGQTVMHLHVHVIPRFQGDMDDPRGGVRYVIPSKGNYLRDVEPLATGGERDPFARHALPLFKTATEIFILAAFVQESGLRRIETDLQSALMRGARIRILTGDYLDITRASALQILVDWLNTSEDQQFTARVIETEQLRRAFQQLVHSNFTASSKATTQVFLLGVSIS